MKKYILHFINDKNESYIIDLLTENNIDPSFYIKAEQDYFQINENLYNLTMLIGFNEEKNKVEFNKLFNFYQKNIVSNKIVDFIMYAQYSDDDDDNELNTDELVQLVNSYEKESLFKIGKINFIEEDIDNQYFFGFRLFLNPINIKDYFLQNQEWIL